jgi:hypothetical protein
MGKLHTSIGKYLGFSGTYNSGGLFKLNELNQFTIPSTGLILHLDAGSIRSYPGTGTIWYDLSPSGYHFNIVAKAYQNIGPKYMDFNGTTGIAKSQISTETAAPSSYTILVWTRIRNSTTQWRTLTRPYTGDHVVICEDGSWRVGMYDNDAAGFLDSGFLQTNFPGQGTGTWMFLHLRINNVTSPFWQMSYNDTPNTIRSSITDSRAYSQRILGNIGGWGESDTTNPSLSSQWWGDISQYYMYNRTLSNDEILQIFNSTRNRFGI